MNNHWHTNYKADQAGPTTFRYALLPHKQYDPMAAQRFGIECSQPLVAVPARGDAPTGPSVPRTRHAGRDCRLDQAERRRQGPDRASVRRRRQAGQGQPALERSPRQRRSTSATSPKIASRPRPARSTLERGKSSRCESSRSNRPSNSVERNSFRSKRPRSRAVKAPVILSAAKDLGRVALPNKILRCDQNDRPPL